MIVSRRWATGDVVVLREVWRGRVWTGRPAIVVADAHDLRVFFVPIGVRWCAPVRPDGRWLHVPTEPWTLRVRTWERSHVLSLAEPGRPHAALAFWDLDWRFEGWYVNVQTPLDPTRLGFDYLDQELDVVIEPDLSAWRWKDEDELEVAIGLGMWTPADARRFRAEAMDWTDRIIRGGPPFDRDWRSWRPDPSWTAPVLPPGWDGLET
jgi:hypothetical protein